MNLSPRQSLPETVDAFWSTLIVAGAAATGLIVAVGKLVKVSLTM